MIFRGASQFCSQARNWSFEAGGRRKEAEGKRQKEGAKRSIFTNMRCSHFQGCDRRFTSSLKISCIRCIQKL
ncbi:hypothetical protein QUB05_12660 [Microcoleus sp. F10-C6]|uniref:hypothetical protein n=1 Tax=unclassified Microcoleus TaxID=2642155 RepID=UPI002FD1BD00